MTVQETRTGQFSVQANVNSNSGINGSIVLNQRNFDILRVPRSLDDLFNGKAFIGGGQELRIEATPGTIFQRYAITFREPYLYDSRFGLTASAYYFRPGVRRVHGEPVRGADDDRLPSSRTATTGGRRSPAGSRGVNISQVPAWATPGHLRRRGQLAVARRAGPG